MSRRNKAIEAALRESTILLEEVFVDANPLDLESVRKRVVDNSAALAMTEEEKVPKSNLYWAALHLIDRWRNGVGTDDPEFAALIPIEDLEALCAALEKEAECH